MSVGILLREFSGDQKNNICFRRDRFQYLSHSFSDIFGICFQVNRKSPLRNANPADSRKLQYLRGYLSLQSSGIRRSFGRGQLSQIQGFRLSFS